MVCIDIGVCLILVRHVYVRNILIGIDMRNILMGYILMRHFYLP